MATPTTKALSTSAAISGGGELHYDHSDDATGRSPLTLLTLPGELRNMIWTKALVRYKIYVTWAFCENTRQQEHSRTCCRIMQNEYEWITTSHPSGTYVGVQKQPKDWFDRVMAFAIRDDADLYADNDQPSLNTLLLCRQVFDEAAPIFYSQNCFVFCATKEPQSDTLETSGLLPAYVFLKDRSKFTLRMIKRIEIQFLDLFFIEADTIPYPLSTLDADSGPQYCRPDLFSLLKANVNLEYLGLYIAGWRISHRLPEKDILDEDVETALRCLLGLRQVDRLAINYVTRTDLLETERMDHASPRGSRIRCHIHPGHGSECFVKAAKEADPYDFHWHDAECGLAHESLRAAAFARLLRHHLLRNGDKKGYQDIKVVMGMRDTIDYLMLSTDDDKAGRSHLEETQDQPQSTPAKHDTAEIDTFAVAGGSGILDQVEPQGWTPYWSTEDG